MEIKAPHKAFPAEYPQREKPADYRIEVLGQLDSSWSDRLSGMQITTMGGKDMMARTVLEGQVMDQSGLSGVLSTLCDLGYPLISVRYIPHTLQQG